jgi:hypothetical protein
VTSQTNLGLELGKSEAQGGRNTINLTDIIGDQTSVREGPGTIPPASTCSQA